MPIEPGKFMLYWAGALAVILLLLFRRPRKGGVRLRLLGGNGAGGGATARATNVPAPAPAPRPPRGERPLNVVFNFNGHSWDAYEVLGLPAGSNLESVRAAYVESLAGVDQTSRPFIEAAYRAITAEWDRSRAG